jgi:hypothetical protein
MSNSYIYLLKDTGELERVPEQPYDREDLLQELVEKFPILIAGEQINPDAPLRWLLLKREPASVSGEVQFYRSSLDHLLLDQNGIPTFFIAKRSGEIQLMREMVGMMLDYAANAATYWPVPFMREMASSQYNGTKGADEAILTLLDKADSQGDAIEHFWRKVDDNLRMGQVRLFFIASQLPGELRRIIEFLNEQMTRAEVLGFELPQFVGPDFRALVPRLVGQTEAITRMKEGMERSSRERMKDEFLSTVSEEMKPFFSNLISEAEKQGMQVCWDEEGFSLKAENNNGKLHTVFYENRNSIAQSKR